MERLQLLVGKGNTFQDCSELISKVTFSGRKGAAPRSVEAVLLDSEGYSQGRAEIDCSEGKLCVLSLKNKELFRGLIMTDTAGSTRKLTFKAYDNCIYLTNNTDSFSYKKKRADQIFKDCLKKLGLPAGTVVNTGYVIPELIKPRTTFWDVIEDALSQTYRSTGKRYYVSSAKGKISLKRRIASEQAVVFEPAANIETYERTRSIENTRTRLKLTTSKGKVKKQYTDTALEKKIGMFQEVQSVDNDVTATELNRQVKVFKAEKSVVSQSLKITGPGDISLVSGGCVYVKIPHLDTERVMYIDEDTHTFENGSHKMTLKLNYAKTIDRSG